ncbi:class I SAM-dependent methyltransferase [Caulobacter sp. KR2-114]|uniref:class I SAM-dependent methyltransferase n=1 Tax=Caulobacter sp. KR2-114 TaxID=3400912 RepID=UPI003C04618B
MSTASNLAPDAFVGTAAAYLRYRPPYPRALLDDLLARTGARGAGVLLDLACGPGRVALDLAPAFAAVWAVDLEPEMVALGQQEAARRGLGHVVWQVGRAEDLDLPAGSVDLITVGEAFHRLDQRLIARKALHWLRPGGWLATLGMDGIFAGREAWQQAAAAVARRWSERASGAGIAQARPGNAVGPGADARALQAAGFADVQSHAFAEPRAWSPDAIVGYLRSTSVCSARALGEHSAPFEAELRAVLADEAQAEAAAEAGAFHETLRSGYTIGRRPD